MNEETITVREAFDRSYIPKSPMKGTETLATILFQVTRRKSIVCFNCKHRINLVEVKEDEGLCPLCKVVLFSWSCPL